MGWDAFGNGICDTCGTCSHVSSPDRGTAVEVMRAMGWHHSKGITIGGDQYEALLCPHCGRDEHRKTRPKTPPIEQDGFDLDWEQYRAGVTGNGFQSR